MGCYEPKLPCDPAQISRFRRVPGEAGVEQLLKSSTVMSTITGSNLVFLTAPIEVAREKIARLALRAGIKLKLKQQGWLASKVLFCPGNENIASKRL